MKPRRSEIRLPAILLLLTLAMSAFAAGNAEKKNSARLKIAYIRPTKELYYACGLDGAQMMAERLRVDLVDFLSDMKGDEETSQVQDAIAQKVDGIILSPVNAISLTRDVDAALEAKIPLLALYGYSDELKNKMAGSVQADIRQSCTMAGSWVAQNIPDGQVGCIMGLPGRGDAEMYRDAFKAEVEKNSKLKVVASVPADWNRQKAFTQMQSLITSFPTLKAVFVQNEDMALGAAQALKEAGKTDQVTIVSQNGAPYGLEAIASGGIKATISWSPSQEAQIALRLLVEMVRDGRTPPKLTISPMKVITKDTLSTATPWEPTPASTDATQTLDLSKLQHDFAK